ncbi:MAG: threonine-phosphate decarboxylase [Thermodesulfobacteriota bacterium]
MIKGHGGNIYDLARELGCPPADIIDMSSNVNPFGPPPGLLDFLAGKLEQVTALPEVDAGEIRRAFAGRHGLDPARVLAGNGTTQLIYILPRSLKSHRALILAPTYADYADACRMNGVPFDYLTADECAGFVHNPEDISRAVVDSGADTVFICNPNNPTGTLLSARAIADLCRTHTRARFIIDESYLGFVPDGKNASMMYENVPDNAIVLNSMSKIFRVPGLRIGFVFASRPVTDAVADFLLPWSVNSLSQAAVAWLMQNNDAVSRFVDQTVALLEEEKQFLADRVKAISGIRLFASVTSFVLAALIKQGQADGLCRFLAGHGILIRNCANFYGLSSRHVRFSLKTRAENSILADKLNDYFKG